MCSTSSMVTKRKRRVPELLWRLFGCRAKTLEETILSLIPPSPEREAACRCRGNRCLGCCGDDPMSFIVQPGDPLDYLQLLKKCFVVVSDAPRPLPVFEDLWTQSEVVMKVIELMRYSQPSTSNLICDNYDKGKRCNLAVEQLTSPKWELLLSRVGHHIMVYLFRHTSIFLPLARKNHLQICGHPISDLRPKFSAPMPRYEVKQKRKRVDRDELPRKQTRVEGNEPLSNSSNISTGNVEDDSNMPKKRSREGQGKRQKKRYQYSDKGTPSSSQCNLAETANCFCCKVFQNKLGMKGNADIDRSDIFYKMEKCSTVLLENHMLYNLKPNRSGASLLFNHIFEAFGVERNASSVPCCHRRNGCRFSCFYHRLTMLLRTLIRNINMYKRERWLEKHCPTRSSCQDASTGAGNVPEVAITKNQTTMPETNLNPAVSIKHCPKRQVVSFIWAVCRRLVPRSLLGGLSSWRSLCRNISKFIELRRFEKFSLKECLYGLKISNFPFFSKQRPGCGSLGVTDSARDIVFQHWISWFFRHLISTIIRANFYVTDSEHEKHALLYFKKSEWQKLMKSYDYGNGKQYVELTRERAGGLIGCRSYGFSKARLLPKKNEFRLLANLRARSRYFRAEIQSNHKLRRHKLRRNASANSVVQDVHLVLRSLQAGEQEKLGASVFDYNDVFKRLVPFLSNLKSRFGDMLNVSMVVCDVAKAFDSIEHKKLFTVMKDVVSSDEYSFEKLTQVICTSKYLKIDEQPMIPREDIIAASKRVKSRSFGRSLGNVVIKKDLSKKISKEEILSLLEEHIKGNLLKIGSKFCLQVRGIPQGSLVSTLLCSFYYGHMETNVIFPFLAEAKKDLSSQDGNCQMEISSTPGCEYLLLRFIDDFFFLSTSKEHASMFYNKFEEVAGGYNCKMNKKKYGLNFAMDHGKVCRSNKLHIGKDNTSFLRWSGLFINCSTVEIQADYTRYLNCHLSSTLTVSRRGKMKRILKEKLKGYLSPKCHPIFYDSNINSPGVVRLNIYQAFLLCAMKFISHLHSLSVLPRFTPKFIFNAIMTSLRYMERMIRRKMHSFKVDPAIRPRYDVSDREVIWLGLCAYIKVVTKKQSRYTNLLCMLRSDLKEGYGEIENMAPELKYAVDDVHSEVLMGIKF